MANTAFFDPRTAIRDLLRELHTRGDPHYPSRSWRFALELAESRDMMRRVKALNDALWPNPTPVIVRYLEDDDPHRLIFLGYAVPTAADPAREIEQGQTVHDSVTDAIYRQRHSKERSAYDKAYRARNWEKYLSWQRDYRHSNADKLNKARRTKRRSAAAHLNG